MRPEDEGQVISTAMKLVILAAIFIVALVLIFTPGGLMAEDIVARLVAVTKGVIVFVILILIVYVAYRVLIQGQRKENGNTEPKTPS
jgi:protein-S-isoprenylcysteine O-methyltransferase Ste14